MTRITYIGYSSRNDLINIAITERTFKIASARKQRKGSIPVIITGSFPPSTISRFIMLSPKEHDEAVKRYKKAYMLNLQYLSKEEIKRVKKVIELIKTGFNDNAHFINKIWLKLPVPVRKHMIDYIRIHGNASLPTVRARDKYIHHRYVDEDIMPVIRKWARVVSMYFGRMGY